MLNKYIYYNFIKYIVVLQFLYLSNTLANSDLYKANPEMSSNNFNVTPSSIAYKYMIVCADKRAALSAKKILERGGNAMDAVIAAQNVLSVVEPQSSGLGGGGFLLYYNSNKNELIGFDGRETAPISASSNIFVDEEKKRLSFLNALKKYTSIGVPGLYSMLADAHIEYGKLKWEVLFKDALDYSNSFIISPRLNKLLKWAPHIKENIIARELYYNNGEAKKSGDLIKNKSLNKSLTILSKDPFSLNNGILASAIAKKTNFILTEKDLASWQTLRRTPICKKYREYNICGFPPPTSGGIGVIQILGILEHLIGVNNQYSYLEKIHYFLEASRLAYLDRDMFVADPSFFDVPTKTLISSSYLKARSNLIKSKKANPDFTPGMPFHKNVSNLVKSKSENKSSTTHISIVDQYGNAAALTSSIEFAFGSGKIVNGFFLNNQLTDFSFIGKDKKGKKLANAVEPKKKPRSSMSPTMIFKDNKLIGVIGSPGGSRIICYVAKIIFEIIENRKEVEDVLNLPNACSRNRSTEIENINKADIFSEKLAEYGHIIKRVEMTSGLNIIWRKEDYWIGSADPRREGVSIGK